ncbi:DNA primase [Candidatus Fermentibacteria bacterium]|nr:DNA primase [Candidatus Fermentibacteria bacterium]
MTGGSGRISPSVVERIREAADIAAVVGRFVTLSRAGRSLKGLCPFHREKTPSFFVSPERQTYHCFGCGAGGDVFSFLMSYLGIPFPDAVAELAQEYGIDVSRDSQPDPGEPLRRVLAEAQAFYHSALRGREGAQAREYLASRALSDSTAEALGIGWAPGGNVLVRHLQKAGFALSAMVDAGLAVRAEDGRTVYDRFRERLLFPIRDRRGRVVSFGGRALGTAAPKYLNGPDTPVYGKGDLLYGFHDARLPARESDTVILVEGYFDHARLHEAGIHFVVATCGTALTPSQARQLSSLASGVLVCYDGDQPGRKAAMKAVEVLLAEKCYPAVIALEGGEDPDEFVSRHGPDAFVEKMSAPLDPVDFALLLAGGWKALERSGRGVTALRRLARLAALSPDPIVRETMARRISESTGYSPASIASAMEPAPTENPDRRIPIETPGPFECTALKAVMLGADGIDRDLLSFLEPGDFQSAQARELFEEIGRQAGEGLTSVVPGLMAPEQASLASRLFSESGTFSPKDAVTVRKSVERARLQRRRAELKASLPGGSPEDRKSILRSISLIDAKLRNREDG